MPRIIPEPRPGEEILGEIDRNGGAYWLVGISAASVPFAANIATAFDLQGLFWGILVPLWILSIALVLSKRKTYYLTNLRIVEVTPFTEKSINLEEVDVVASRGYFLGLRSLPNPFGTTLVFGKDRAPWWARFRISYVKNPDRVLDAVETAVAERRVLLHNVAHRPRARRTAVPR